MEYNNLKAALEDLGVDFVKELTNQLLAADKKATGQLINSLDWRVVEVFEALFLNITADSYLKWVDEGRRPGRMPPSQVFLSGLTLEV
jgi:hypothetical protein